MNRVILVGKAASGKDHLRKVLEGRGFTYGISYTTRPPRKDEVDGRDYFFIEEDEFRDRIDRKFWYEYVEFNGWLYGTSKEQFYDECNLFIMTPKGVAHIDPIDRKKCTIIYIDIPIDVRRNRLSTRQMPGDSLERRIQADEADFLFFNDFDIRIDNPNF